jgi:zinc transport system ATP-binding protein
MQRALLCRAIISEPKLLILDEPANFVDNRFESELYDILKRLNERMAIVMVSHNINAVSSAVKSIVCVNRTIHRHNTNTLSERELNRYCFIK